MKRKISLDDRISAIIDRDSGIPYTEVLEKYDITPGQFFRAVRRDIGTLTELTTGETKQTLQQISSNRDRERELFNMGEEFVKEQYCRVMEGAQACLYWGTFVHPENVNALVYHALTSKHLKLASNNRQTVVEGIKNLPFNLKDHFHSLGLNGLMIHAFEKGKQGSPLAVLEVFDRAYRRKTEDVSLFDLTQKDHLHKWGDNFNAPRSYWQNPANVEEAIYHTLTENHPELASQGREEVVQGIKNLPRDLFNYFRSLGLGGLMAKAFEKGKQNSPLAVLEVFDRVYQKNNNDASLFDLTQKKHLHKWDFTPQSYWKKPAHVEEAIYHTLTENRSELASQDRREVIQGIKNLPRDLLNYFHNLGLNGLMGAFEKGKQGSPLAVLEVFDRAYQRETRNPSLFDKSQDDYLEISGKERHKLIRK